MAAEFKIGDRVRFHHFAGKIADRAYMHPPTLAKLRFGPDGYAIKVTHVLTDAPEEQRYLGWEFCARPAELEHID